MVKPAHSAEGTRELETVTQGQQASTSSVPAKPHPHGSLLQPCPFPWSPALKGSALVPTALLTLVAAWLSHPT